MSTHTHLTPELVALRDAIFAHFPTEKVSRLQTEGKAFDFIAIEDMLDRVHELFPFLWDDKVISTDSKVLGTDHRNRLLIMFEATVELTFYASLKDRYANPPRPLMIHSATGAHTAIGPNQVDMGTKTALANARKKALNAAGIGHYLFHEEGRAELEAEREQLRQEKARADKERIWNTAGVDYVANPNRLAKDDLIAFAAYHGRKFADEQGEVDADWNSDRDVATYFLEAHGKTASTAKQLREALVEIFSGTDAADSPSTD